MAALGTVYSNAVMNALVNRTALTVPPAVYVALTTSASSPSGIGTEAAYTGYARVTGASAFGTSASGTISNSSTLTFGACTGGSSNINGFALMDASSGGNVIFFGSTSSTLAVSSGITPSFAVGALVTSDV